MNLRKPLTFALGLCLVAFAWGVTPSLAASGEPTAEFKRLKDYDLPGLQERVSLESLEAMDVAQLIEYLAYRGGLNNVVIGQGVAGKATKLKFQEQTVADALEVVLSVNDLAYVIQDDIITIMTDDDFRQKYGTSFYNQTQVRIVKLKYADPEHVSKLLAEIKSDIGTVVSDKVTGSLILIDTPGKIREMRAIIDETDLPTISRQFDTETRTYVLQYAEVEDIENELEGLLTEDIGSVRSDTRTKTLIVTDLPHVMAKIDRLVSEFDVPRQQVLIEARVVEVELTDEYRLGINWEHVFESLDPRFRLESTITPSVAGPEGGAFTPPSGSGTLRYQTILGGGDLSVLIAALKDVGRTEILSTPHVTVESDSEATIKVVRDQPYAEAQLESGTTNVVGERINFIEVGTKLSVTPRISDDRFISMAIKPEVSTVVGQYQAFRVIPIVQKAYAETTVRILDGQTIIIAGLIRNQSVTRHDGVPVLGQIPILGTLFRSESDALQTTETVVFLTPTIVGGDRPFLLSRDRKKDLRPLRSVGDDNEKAMRTVR